MKSITPRLVCGFTQFSLSSVIIKQLSLCSLKKKSRFVEESVDFLPDLPIKNFQVGWSKGHLIYVLQVYVICGVSQGIVRVFEID